MYRIMIVEDDEKLRVLMKSSIERYGYLVCLVNTFSDITKDFIRNKCELIIMDINLPYYDGFYWCRKIREISNVPIIFVSSRASDMDQVMAIENGGDDYIIKPFSVDVLIAKIKGMLRRSYGTLSQNTERYELYNLVIDVSNSTLEFNGIKVELSKNEFSLMHILSRNIDKIVSRDTLLEALWSDTDFVDDNTLSVNMTRLRKKLEGLSIMNCIDTKRGQGYMMKCTWRI